MVVSPRVVTLCSSLNALADLTVAFTTLSWVPYLSSGISGLVVAALAALFFVDRGIVLAFRTSVVVSDVFPVVALLPLSVVDIFVLVDTCADPAIRILAIKTFLDFGSAVTLCDSLYALAGFAVAFATLSWIPYLGSGISGLVVAGLAALFLVDRDVVLAFRTAVVLSSVFVWACIDELIANGSGVGEILDMADARVPLAAVVAPTTVNTAPVFARKSIPRVRWSTRLLTTNSSRLKVISPILTSTVMLRLLSSDAPSTIRMVWVFVLECVMWGINPIKSSRMMLLVAPVSTTPVVARPPMVREATRISGVSFLAKTIFKK
uniref:Uncharacterized protein n=1 Tax=Glossina palpalis gambiensis TaxID=67801 RepID=A0A1B0B447_9MUSC